MLARRRRRRANIKTALGQCLVFGGVRGHQLQRHPENEQYTCGTIAGLSMGDLRGNGGRLPSYSYPASAHAINPVKTRY